MRTLSIPTFLRAWVSPGNVSEAAGLGIWNRLGGKDSYTHKEKRPVVRGQWSDIFDRTTDDWPLTTDNCLGLHRSEELGVRLGLRETLENDLHLLDRRKRVSTVA